MAAGTYPFEHLADTMVAEARAYLSAVILLNELGFREVVVEGDSLTIMKKLRVHVEDRLAISVLIKEIRVRAQNFDSVEYNFIPRQGN